MLLELLQFKETAETPEEFVNILPWPTGCPLLRYKNRNRYQNRNQHVD